MDSKEKVTQMCFILFLAMGSDLIYIFLLPVEMHAWEVAELMIRKCDLIAYFKS